MDSYATSEPRDAPVFTASSRHVGEEAPKKRKEMKDDIRREDELLDKLEEMFQKLQNGCLKKDAWAGEDIDCPPDTKLKDVIEMRKTSKKKKLSQAELLANKTTQKSSLFDAKNDRKETAPTRRNRFSFREKQAVPQKNAKEEGKIKSEDQLRELMTLALQRHGKKKRRRTRGPRNGQEHITTEEHVQTIEDGSCKEKQTSPEKMIRDHTELFASHLPKKNMELDEVKVLQADESSKTTNVRNVIRAVHNELLNVFNSGARKAVPDYHEKVKTKREQMLAVHDEIKKTVIQIKSAARTEDFVQMKAKNEEMAAIHSEIKAKHSSTKNTDLDAVKKYVNEIVHKAQQKVLEEETALKILQSEESAKTNATRAVLEELLNVFNSGARKTIPDYHEKAKAKREQMLAVHDELKKTVILMKSTTKTESFVEMKAKKEMSAIHAEIKRLVFLKGLCLEEDDDDNFVPRKMFLSDIDNFRTVSQIKVPLHEYVRKNINENQPSCSDEESKADHVEESKAPLKNERRSLGQRLLRFIGFRKI